MKEFIKNMTLKEPVQGFKYGFLRTINGKDYVVALDADLNLNVLGRAIYPAPFSPLLEETTLERSFIKNLFEKGYALEDISVLSSHNKRLFFDPNDKPKTAPK